MIDRRHGAAVTQLLPGRRWIGRRFEHDPLRGACQPQSLFPQPGIVTGRGEVEIGDRQPRQAVEDAEGVDAGDRRRGWGIEQGPHRVLGIRGGKAPLDEEPLRRVAAPAVWIGEERDGLDSGSRRGPDAGGEVGAADAPDPPGLVAGPMIDRGGDPGGHVVGMLDARSAEVDDPQGAVGRRGREHRPEPGLGRGDKFAPFVLRMAAPEAGAPRHRAAADNRMGDRLAGKGVAIGLGAEEIAAEDRQAAGGRVRAGVGDGRRVGRRHRRHPAVGAAGGGVGVARTEIDQRVADERFRRQEADHERIAIASGEAVAARVEGIAKLPEAGDGADRAAGEIEANIAPVDRHAGCVGIGCPPHRSPGEPAADPDGVVGADRGAGGPELRIADAESGGESGVRLERAIAIGVGQKEEIGGGGDQQPAAGGEDPLGKGEMFGHGGRRLEVAVAVGVVQANDARERGRAGRRPRGVVAVFHHERGAMLVERHRHGIDHGRFSGDQFEDIPGGHGCVAEHSLRRRGDRWW